MKSENKFTLVGIIVGSLLAIIPICYFLYDRYSTNYDGKWILNTTVVETEYSEYKNCKNSFVLHLEQRGNVLSGEGEKTSYNGKKLTGTQRHTLTFTGKVVGDSIILKYTENGKQRPTIGHVYLAKSNDGSYKGCFDCTAGDSKGLSQLTR